MGSREDAQRWRYPECRWAQCARGRGVGDVRREQVSQVVSQRPTLCRGSETRDVAGHPRDQRDLGTGTEVSRCPGG